MSCRSQVVHEDDLIQGYMAVDQRTQDFIAKAELSSSTSKKSLRNALLKTLLF